jgi:transcriptional regulator with XRE-family HTH domain
MPGPTIRRRQLGLELLRLREAAGISRAAAAETLGCSPAKIGHIEAGRYAPSKTDLLVLLRDHYKVDDSTLTALENLRAEASQRGWWSTYGLPETLAGYIGLESDANSVCMFELELIPGLFQTEAYARVLYELVGRLPAKEINRRVAARMQRQHRLTNGELQLTAVISQGVLERCAQHDTVGAQQLQQLAERADWPNAELLVLPFSRGLHVGMPGPFSLLSFPDDLLAPVAYYEYVVGSHIIDDPAVVSQLANLFNELRSQALDANESLTMIAQLAKHSG